jgi:hypothetical protein
MKIIQIKLKKTYIYIHTHTHTHIYIYMYICIYKEKMEHLFYLNYNIILNFNLVDYLDDKHNYTLKLFKTFT